MEITYQKQPERPAHVVEKILAQVTWEHLVFAALLAVAIFTRFYNLELRVMSHDETQHTYFSWLFYKGNGYQHTPLTHGPLQFHLMALSFAIFGDSELSARIPYALASSLAVLFMWNYRKYLGKAGTLVATLMFIFSPYMLYYGRYSRNEAYIQLFGLITLWAILRYLDSGKAKYLVYLTLGTVLHFTAKETAFIYTAQALVFITILLVQRVATRTWVLPKFKRSFLAAVMGGFLFIGATLTLGVLRAGPADAPDAIRFPAMFLYVPEILAILSFGAAIYLVLRGLGLAEIRRERSFDIAMLLGILVLPQLAPFPVEYLGWNPLDYSSTGILRTSVFFVPLMVGSILLGLWWNKRLFLINAALYYVVYVVLYTSVFTNGIGFFTGMVGSLGYWLEQQGVERGSQPWYYYLLVQIPIYEYLPLAASLFAAGVLGWKNRRRVEQNAEGYTEPAPEGTSEGEEVPFAEEFTSTVENTDHVTENKESYPQTAPTTGLFIFWSISSILAYSVAGEKMPWLTVHITLPMILLGGWGIGKLIESVDWREFADKKAFLILALLFSFTISLSASFDMIQRWLEGQVIQPVQWPGMVAYVGYALVSALLLLFLLRDWTPGEFMKLATMGIFGILFFYSARTAIQASYLNYDLATEYLVYAHSAPANKELTKQLTDLSLRVNGDMSLGIAYDSSDGKGDPGAAWPLTWYIRNFTNKKSFGPEVSRDLLNYPVIIASDRNWDKVEPLVQDTYESFEYIRMWWPNMDYFNLNRERVVNAVRDPAIRNAIIDIWQDRNFQAYGQATGLDTNIENWTPSRRMRVYLRKDINNNVWSEGSSPVVVAPAVDPYEGGQIDVVADHMVGSQGSEAGQFEFPRGVAAAADGSIYVADTGNHRVQHLSESGEVLHVWGSFSGDSAAEGGAGAPGTFNEPWGIAVGPDGAVYVADTWNNRVQKFGPEGEFITTWGFFGQGEDPEAFWGPRGIAVDALGRVYVSDTGNKRVVVFTSEGNPVSIIDLEFNEPVGVTAGPDGKIYVADTWNQRIIVVSELAENIYSYEVEWPIDGWFGQSLDNKPYLAAAPNGNLFVSDPEGYRVLEFQADGTFVRTWGRFGTESNHFGLPAGLSVTNEGGVWVADSAGHRMMHFTLP